MFVLNFATAIYTVQFITTQKQTVCHTINDSLSHSSISYVALLTWLIILWLLDTLSCYIHIGLAYVILSLDKWDYSLSVWLY